MKLFGGVQQIGLGVEDAAKAWDWYRGKFGFDIPLVDDTGVAGDMLPYTGNRPHKRRAILAINLQGGGALEIWQYLDRSPLPCPFELAPGDLGIFAAKLRTADLRKVYLSLGGGAARIASDPAKREHFFTRDPFGNSFQIVADDNRFGTTRALVGGVFGAIIGVSNAENSMRFFRDTLGYDTVVYDAEGSFEDLSSLPGGNGRFRRALIARSAPSMGPFAALLGPSEIELLQSLDREPRKPFAGRLWGDLGFIHLCFDVQGMADYKRDCAALGHPFTADSNPGSGAGRPTTFEMGEASGRFAYLEDPDGTLIELVETHRIPIVAKLGWYLDLRRRGLSKPLPRWMLHMLGVGRVRA